MGALEGFAEFAQGASQGVGQGLDLYERYQQVQDRKTERDKKARLDQFFQQSMQAGDFDDPSVGLEKAAQFALENNMFDEYNKFYSTAAGLKKAKTQRTGMQFQSVLMGSQDPSPAIPILNQFAKEAGLGVEYGFRPTPGGGGELITMQNGKSTSRAFKDIDELKVNLLQAIEPVMFDDYADYSQVQNERTKTAAQAARDRAAGALDNIQAQYAGKKAEADIAQSDAARVASLASAENSRASAAQTSATTDATIREKEARAKYYEGQGDNVTDTLSKLDPKNEGLDPTITPDRDPQVIDPIATDLAKQNGLTPNEAIGITSSLLGGGPLRVGSDGSVVVSGKPYKLSSAQLQAIINTRAAASAVEE